MIGERTLIAPLALDCIRTDGGTQPRINQDWAIIGEYAQDMLKGDVFPPVIVYFDDVDYWLADGFHRYHASKQICRDAIDAEIRQGTQRDAILHSVSTNSQHGFRRNNADKRRSVVILLRDEEWSKWSDREIARQCGVSQPFVSKLRDEIGDNGYQMTRKVERNGTEYTIVATNIGHSQPVESETPIYGKYLEGKPIEDMPFFERWQRDNVSLGLDRFGDPLPKEIEPRRNIDNIPIAVPHISSKNNEWYTPVKYINAAKKLMNGIDLDPASCAFANETVDAADYYHISKSGLEHDWWGRVWLNPPYGYTDGESNQALWSNRLIDQYTNGNITEAVLLVNAAVDTSWFQRLLDYPVCFTRGRINFTTPEPVANGSTHGSAFVYFGPQPDEFFKIFSEFGRVVRAW